MGPVYFGTAGWDYADWHGRVYPADVPKKFDALPFIARYFDCVEINRTFYRPATRKEAASWADRASVNPRFRFTGKLWQRFTHEPRTTWTRADIREGREGFDALRRRGVLGAVLVQMPWSFKRRDKDGNLREDSRDWLNDVLDAFDDLPLVLEVRHASWNEPEFFEELDARGVGIAAIDQPKLFKDSLPLSPTATGRVGYVRLHGRNYKDWGRGIAKSKTAATRKEQEALKDKRFDYLYSAKELAPIAKVTGQISRSGVSETYAIANNHARGQAPANALMLKAILTGKPQPAPPELFRTYEAELKDFAYPDAHGTAAHDADAPAP